ncbi:hypothetical protein ACHHYP_12886 [Achlya hypogyna]|uniref:Myb-like domain-containing protein n=1 Tax=Achlya hypogyna TaxID=1202772 RepID=A0A1V9ZG21_ACHHY|nr:hypothetical protein ACHHYP_12886 [Achlya hypogyna]
MSGDHEHEGGKRKPAYRFSTSVDIDLLKEIVDVCPHSAPHGQTAARWEEVGNNMRRIHGEAISATGCRKRYDDLMAALQKGTLKSLRASGTEEQCSTREQLLQDLAGMVDLITERKRAVKDEKYKKTLKHEVDIQLVKDAVLKGVKRKSKEADADTGDHKRKAADTDVGTVPKGLKRKAADGDTSLSAIPDPQTLQPEPVNGYSGKEPKDMKTSTDDDMGVGGDGGQTPPSQLHSTTSVQEAADIVCAFTAMMENSNKLKMEELAVQKEANDIAQRKLELEELRYLLDKAEREARFALEQRERQGQLEFMHGALETLRALAKSLLPKND